MKEELEGLLKIAAEKPYYGLDYSMKRRKLTKRLKNIFSTCFGENSKVIVELFTSRRGFTPSDALLKHCSKVFENELNAIIAACDRIVKLDEEKKIELKKEILKAVIEIKTNK
jgi:hypothetical protein